jgi:hypothetical protein
MATGIDSTTSLIAPDIAAQQVMLQRQQAMADLLRQQSLTPDQGQMIGQQYIAPSWTQGLARMAQALMASKSQDSIDVKNLDLAKSYGDRIGAMFGQGAPDASTAAPAALAQGAIQGDVGPTNSNAERMGTMLAQGSGTAPQGGGLTINGMSPSQAKMAFMLDKGAYMGGYMKQFDPTEATKMALAAGADPRQANADALFKNSYVAPENIRPGGWSRDPRTGQATNFPVVPEGFQGVQIPGGGFKIQPAAGALDAISLSEASKLKGKNMETLAPVGQSVTLEDGTTLPTTVDATIHGNPSVGNGLDISKLSPQEQQLLRQTDPSAYDAGVARFKAKGVGAPFGMEQGAKNSQDEFSKRWSQLQTDNSTAQTTTSYLQSIKELAKKANAGAGSDKWAFVNGLLAPFGNERANDELTAKNLLEKYSNQITTRLGAGGMGTDAARSILQSAYPNSHMQPDAINEAVDNLVGANEMVKAKTKFLQAPALKRDPKAYSENEIQFDQNADPRVWQLKNMPPENQGAFVKKMDPATAADLLKRIQTLKKMGAY